MGDLGIPLKEIWKYDPGDHIISTLRLKYILGADAEGEKMEVTFCSTQKPELEILAAEHLDALATELQPTWDELEKKTPLSIETFRQYLLRFDDDPSRAIVVADAQSYFEQEAKIVQNIQERLQRGVKLVENREWENTIAHACSLRSFFIQKLYQHYTTLLEKCAEQIHAREEDLADKIYEHLRALIRDSDNYFSNPQKYNDPSIFPAARELLREYLPIMDKFKESYAFADELNSRLAKERNDADTDIVCLNMLEACHKKVMDAKNQYETLKQDLADKKNKAETKVLMHYKALASNRNLFLKIDGRLSSAYLGLLNYLTVQTEELYGQYTALLPPVRTAAQSLHHF